MLLELKNIWMRYQLKKIKMQIIKQDSVNIYKFISYKARAMKKSFVRKSRKRKLNQPLQVDKNAQDVARQRLFQISDHINAFEQAQKINNKFSFLKVEEEKPEIKVSFPDHFVSPKRNSIKLRSMDFRNPQLSEIFKQSLRIISSQIQGKQVFVAKKSVVNVTNYMIMDDRQMHHRTINFRSHSSQKPKMPNNFRKIMRKKNVSSSILNNSSSLQYSSQLTPKINENKLDMTLRTKSVSFQRSYSHSKQRQKP